MLSAPTDGCLKPSSPSTPSETSALCRQSCRTLQLHSAMTTPIPRPPTIPFLGNATLIDADVPIRSFNLLAKQYGEIFELNLLGRTFLNLCSYDVVKDTMNEKVWRKALAAPLRQVRHLTGDGLFTVRWPLCFLSIGDYSLCSGICRPRMMNRAGLSLVSTLQSVMLK